MTVRGRKVTFRVFRGEAGKGKPIDYEVPISEGMVVLDALHYIQGYLAPDLAVRWNCKAAKCGSCGAEVNGRPRLTCKSRLDDLPLDEPVIVEPMRSFLHVRDLVANVDANFDVNQRIPAFAPREDAEFVTFQPEVERIQEFRKCLECFLCQDVCHVIRSHGKLGEFAGPAFFARIAALDMHPLDSLRRTRFLKERAGLGYCNITKCCTDVCPESIRITDNAIIPLKERVVDDFYDPLGGLIRKLARKTTRQV
ncbi:MAG: succinate dehydrogenase/fumarate reductase iron-sulfur subunit [Planctomycetota bacterium]|jgi:succinate dehydrogenase / fumarate reductase iron-sulfur subunit